MHYFVRKIHSKMFLRRIHKCIEFCYFDFKDFLSRAKEVADTESQSGRERIKTRLHDSNRNIGTLIVNYKYRYIKVHYNLIRPPFYVCRYITEAITSTNDFKPHRNIKTKFCYSWTYFFDLPDNPLWSSAYFKNHVNHKYNTTKT